MATKSQSGGARQGSGRKPLAAGFPTIPVVVRMTEPQKEKLKRLGGPGWVRQKIDAAKEPKQE